LKILQNNFEQNFTNDKYLYLLINLSFIFFFALNLNFLLVSNNFSVFIASLSGLFSIYVVYKRDSNLRNWHLLFFTMFFVFYFLGGFLGKLLIDLNESYVDLPTNFNKGISILSEFRAYNYSGLICQLILLFTFFFNKDNLTNVLILKHDKTLYKISVFFLSISIPIVLVNSFFELKYYLAQGFSFYYTQDGRFVSPIYFSALFYNVYVFSCFLFLISKPFEKKFNFFLFFYLIISLLESLKGTRSVIIINFLFIFWYRAEMFNKGKINFKALSIATLIFIFFLSFAGVVRQNVDVFSISDIYNLILKGLSTGQYQLALYLENSNFLEDNELYILYPILFPFYYLIYGEGIVYQSIERLTYPMDINHAISSKINQDWYLSGAANGNNFVMELIYSWYSFFGVILFFFLYTFFYRKRNSNKVFLLVWLILLRQLIISPRDSVFPNTWFILKALIFYFIVSLIRIILVKKYKY
jgi:hypothetical protein